MVNEYPTSCPLKDDIFLSVSNADFWSVHRAASPLIGTAIHNGHGVREDLSEIMPLDPSERLREEDPFTEYAIRDVPKRVVCHRSRFEIDLNRARSGAVYLAPDQAWGLDIWARRQNGPRSSAPCGCMTPTTPARSDAERYPG
jgi:N-formylglutamate amidohydrolase